MSKVKHSVLALLLLMAAFLSYGCGNKSEKQPFELPVFSSYRDIPGVTDEEINAIEELKSKRQSFTYMSPLTTETFVLPDGTYAGFTAKFCELLSNLFEIPFVIEIGTWNDVMNKFDEGADIFTGEMTPTIERRQTYFMTLPVAQRALGVFTHKDSDKLET
ncbi:MAG: transporter substrate-binding domain-containing protein, partial [Fibromonadaceae bacterium]|nr:transporter substrate-binding domain-containing protein [Fibromonadaceae bacterium]